MKLPLVDFPVSDWSMDQFEAEALALVKEFRAPSKRMPGWRKYKSRVAYAAIFCLEAAKAMRDNDVDVYCELPPGAGQMIVEYTDKAAAALAARGGRL